MTSARGPIAIGRGRIIAKCYEVSEALISLYRYLCERKKEMVTALAIVCMCAFGLVGKAVGSQYMLQVGETYTYDIEYGETGESEGLIECRMEVRCSEPPESEAPLENVDCAPEYRLAFLLSKFKCRLGERKRLEERMNLGFAEVGSFAFSADMDRSGRLFRYDSQPEPGEGEAELRKRLVFGNAIWPIVASIWQDVFPRFAPSVSELRGGMISLQNRDWLSLEAPLLDARLGYRQRVLNIRAEMAPDDSGRMSPTGRTVFWQNAATQKLSKELGDDYDLTVTRRARLFYKDGLVVECNVEVRTKGEHEYPTSFFRARLIEPGRPKQLSK
jgi:hypothetical protein